MIRGYPHRPSVPTGGALGLHISTDAERFRVDFYRRGNELVLVLRSEWYEGVNAPAPPHPDGKVGPSPAEAWGWPLYKFSVPEDWRTGLYLAVFVTGDSDGAATSFPDPEDIEAWDREWFIVMRAVPGASNILYKKEFATRTAYNPQNGSGGNLYADPVYVNESGYKGHKVSLHRSAGGTGWLIAGELKFIAWLERNGFVIDYCTDIDIHEDTSLLSHYKLLLAVGHEEYWSSEMRGHIEAFVDAGGNVAFFSGNTCWWRIRFVDDNTAYVCDTDHAVHGEYPYLLAKDQWWTPEPRGVGNPENRLTGVSFRNGGAWANGPAVGYTVQNSSHWVFAGTGLRDGDILGESVSLVGYECDGAAFVRDKKGIAVATGDDGTPSNFLILGVAELSPVAAYYYDTVQLAWHCAPREPSTKSPYAATMGIYEASGTVFTGSAVEWPKAVGGGFDPIVERVARNVIERLMGISGFTLDHDLPGLD